MHHIQLELIDDCYHKAEPGEPKFTLLARDPLAANLVAIWAYIRAGNVIAATREFGNMIDKQGQKYIDNPSDENKTISAHDIADEMSYWFSK